MASKRQENSFLKQRWAMLPSMDGVLNRFPALLGIKALQASPTASSAGLSPSLPVHFFPFLPFPVFLCQGPVELVEHFIAKCNSKMLEELRTLDLEHMSLKEKIRTAFHIRLKQYAPFIATWPQVHADR